ncbi:MAG: hypothetical protein DRH37_09460 [Deltaproteobacteria bacterium]|nr:MAG: hypothetical protein DRH37_09460 [Deltaproteobacteria bacterium]
MQVLGFIIRRGFCAGSPYRFFSAGTIYRQKQHVKTNPLVLKALTSIIGNSSDFLRILWVRLLEPGDREP